MTRYIIRRLLFGFITLVGASLAVFVLVRVIPGDAAQMLLPEGATEAELAQMRQRLGLDQPLWVQYGIFLRDALQGDFGDSFQHRRPAIEVVLSRIPATVLLALISMGITVLAGIPAGIIAALRRNSWLDFSIITAATLGQSLPSFWLGLMLIVVLGVALRWLPVAGGGTWKHAVMPALTLAAYPIALVARLSRSALLEVLDADYIRTARAKGISELAILVRHALRNAALPVVTVLSLQFATLLGGAVVVETVFSWPGVGSLVLQAVQLRDYPIVQVVLMLSAAGFIGINLLTDIAYAWLDPRIRFT